MGAFGGVLVIGAGCLAVWLFVNPLPRVLATAGWRGHLLLALLLGGVAGTGVLSSSAARARLLEGPVLCVFFTVALLGSGVYVTRVARRKDAN
jgi:hypothetical protein